MIWYAVGLRASIIWLARLFQNLPLEVCATFLFFQTNHEESILSLQTPSFHEKAEDLTSNHNSLKTHNCFRFLNIDVRRKSTAKLKNCRIRSYCALRKKENRQEKKDNLYFISKYLYTSGQIVVPALARKSLLAATSQACSPSQRPTI